MSKLAAIFGEKVIRFFTLYYVRITQLKVVEASYVGGNMNVVVYWQTYLV